MQELEGRDIFADDFIRQEQFMSELETPSEIQQFFDGATVLVTGATGFFGKILTEKLLRVCSKLDKMYLLMRPKKGKSVQERFDEQFEGPLFERLRKAFPDFKQKVHIIQADMAEEVPIPSEEDRQKIIQNVNVVFHCAATVRFDEKLRRASYINVISTKFLLDMAREMKNLKAFVHVSTAYSNCPVKEIDERFYAPPYDYKSLYNILEAFDDTLLDKITPDLIGNFPNTYAFTKMIAESVIKDFGKGLPVGILRPSIVISTYKEPISGWINNFYGPQGVVFGAGIGLLRTLHCNPTVVADMVPADLVINALIALAWDLGQTKGDNPNLEEVSWKRNTDSNSNVRDSEEIPILNYVSSERNPITWGRFLDINYRQNKDNCSPIQIWYSSLTLNANYQMDRVYRVVCHYLPALIVDCIAVLMQKKPMLWESYKKIHKFSSVISYFCTSQWKFKEENVLRLWSKLSPKDKRLFFFDIRDLIWEQYFIWYINGMRVYLLNEGLSSDTQGKKRAIKLKIIHYLVVAVAYGLLFYLLYKIFSFLFI